MRIIVIIGTALTFALATLSIPATAQLPKTEKGSKGPKTWSYSKCIEGSWKYSQSGTLEGITRWCNIRKEEAIQRGKSHR
jgi:hypothetical protein